MNSSGKTWLYVLFLALGLLMGLIGGNEMFKILKNRSDAAPLTSHENSVDTLGSSRNIVSEVNEQKQEQNTISFSRRNAIVNATQTVSPSVVGIVVTQLQVVQSRYYSNDFFDFFFAPEFVPRLRPVKNIGSGFVIRSDGLIMTNYHVIQGASKLYVNFADGRQLTGEIIGADAQSDIAIVKVDGERFRTVKMGNSDQLLIGEWAIAIGNPFLNFINDAHPTVTVGVVSALNRNFSSNEEAYYSGMIQTDAAINPGNSGGPLLDGLGRVIGVNTVIFSGGKSKGWVGIGFAIPINRARKVATELIKYGRRRQVWTGISAQELTRQVALALGYNRTNGVVIVGISRNSPGASADLKRGDVITRIGTHEIQSSADLEVAFVDYFVGDKVDIEFVRGGKEYNTMLVLKEYPNR